MKKLVSLIAAAVALLVAMPAYATNYTLWIHGRHSGTPSGWSYWQSDNSSYVISGTNVVAVNYDGYQHIATTNPIIVSALDTYCTGSNACYVACHSAGCAQIGYAIDWHQPMRWNIMWVATGGSAAGGSELANAGSWMTGNPIDSDLQVGTMRGMYNHDTIGNLIWGYVYTYVGGDYAVLTNCFFPGSGWACFKSGGGGNDSVVAFHSSGHFRNSGNYGSGSFGGGSFWNYTISNMVDSTNGNYGHCVSGSYPCQEGNWGGIMGAVSGEMRAYAN